MLNSGELQRAYDDGVEAAMRDDPTLYDDHVAGLRAVERAARAAAFREAAEVCEGVHRHRDSLGLSHGYNAIMDCVDALRARAEVDGEGGR